MGDKRKEVKEFWQIYKDIVIKTGVPVEKAVWYVRWAEKFAKSIKGKPLRMRNRQDVEIFLADLGENGSPWQVEQAKAALGILYSDFLKIDLEKESPEPETFRDAGSLVAEAKNRYIDAFEGLRNALRVRHYSLRTEQSYGSWLARFLAFHDLKSPKELGSEAIREYLNYLARVRQVSASTQNQALNAIVFFYREALGNDAGDFSDFVRARKPRRLPVVLSREEVESLLVNLDGVYHLQVGLLYGGGLRLMECLRLRVKDVDFSQGQIMIRDGKGQKDRLTVLPEKYVPLLQGHLVMVRKLFEQDSEQGIAGVYIWPSLARKYPNASKQWGWQYLFPARRLSVDPRSGEVRRHHLHESGLQRVVKKAAEKAGLVKNVGCHTMRHCFATHLLEGGYDIRTVQELMGHEDVSTTMIYTHVLNRPGIAVRSPADF